MKNDAGRQQVEQDRVRDKETGFDSQPSLHGASAIDNLDENSVGKSQRLKRITMPILPRVDFRCVWVPHHNEPLNRIG